MKSVKYIARHIIILSCCLISIVFTTELIAGSVAGNSSLAGNSSVGETVHDNGSDLFSVNANQ